MPERHHHRHKHDQSLVANPADNLEYLASRSKQSRAVIIFGAIANIILSVIKVIAGWFGHSHALFADGIHSLSDLVSDGLVYLASKYGNQAADKEHPYGHERIETFTTIIIAVILAFAGISIVIDAIEHITFRHNEHISRYVLWVAVISLAINELVYRVTIFVAKRVKSEMLKAHAWHRRSDAAASLVVLIGIVGAMMGWAYLDGVAAIIVGTFIVKMAWKMGRDSFDELIDRGVNDDELAEIQKTIQDVDGVRTLHQLRTRLMAGRFIADVHILVDPHLSVSEGHYIGEHVQQALANRFPNFSDITVHVDPEDDEYQNLTQNYPSRKKVVQQLEKLWKELPGYYAMQIIALHYLHNHFGIEIALPLTILEQHSAADLDEAYSKNLSEIIANCRLKILYY